jgi:KipI family sensor histidine kinase inhibitor
MTVISIKPHAILPLGDSAVYVEFSEVLDLAVNEAAQALAAKIRVKALPWIVDIVPTLGGVALHFDVEHVDLPDSPLEAAQAMVSECLDMPDNVDREAGRLIEIPVCYEAEFGLDLVDIAARVGLSIEQVVQKHSAADYRVLMMGFVPGGPYMGGLDPAINLPRRSSPRTKVIQGSVALANLQVVIYPFTTPGGWHIVGRTPARLFVADRQPACLLSPRDRVRFVPISTAEFRRLESAQAQR